MSKLTDDEYERPTRTFTDNLTKEEIKHLLEDYKEMDIDDIKIGTHVRYLSYVNGKYKFRMGGMLTIIKGLPEYVVLSNGTKTWSVQVENTIFFARLSINEVKQEFLDKLDEKNNQINGLVNINKKLESENKKLKTENKKLELEIKKLVSDKKKK